jgi:hypothetical protein
METSPEIRGTSACNSVCTAASVAAFLLNEVNAAAHGFPSLPSSFVRRYSAPNEFFRLACEMLRHFGFHLVLNSRLPEHCA